MLKIAGIIAMLVVFGIFVFHVVHYHLFCKYRKVPGKSHCGKCGHREVCKNYHFKNERRS